VHSFLLYAPFNHEKLLPRVHGTDDVYTELIASDLARLHYALIVLG